MATHFWVSEKQWVGKSLDPADFKIIQDKGFGVAWKHGGCMSFVQKKDDAVMGSAKVKGDVVTPDAAFASVFKSLTGHPFKQGAMVDSLSVTATAAVSAPNVQQVKKPKPQGAQANPAPVVDASVNLSTVTDVGGIVKGTQKPYRVYMISDDVNLAYRYTGTGLSIRAEKFTEEARTALVAWGLEAKVGDRPYASVHLQVASPELVARALGSLLASVLTKPPAKLLPAKEICK